MGSLANVSKRVLRGSEAVALGRNCALFDSLRHHAYKSIRKYRKGKVDVWRAYILDKANEQNVFSERLPASEIKAIAKSVANWVWKHMRYDTEAFKQRQSARGQLSGKARLSKANNLKMSAIILLEQGHSISEIARQLQVNRRTVQLWFK